MNAYLLKNEPNCFVLQCCQSTHLIYKFKDSFVNVLFFTFFQRILIFSVKNQILKFPTLLITVVGYNIFCRTE